MFMSTLRYFFFSSVVICMRQTKCLPSFDKCFRDVSLKTRRCDVIENVKSYQMWKFGNVKNVDLPRFICKKGRFQSEEEIPIISDPH